MLLQTVVFALVGAGVGAFAAIALPAWFPVSRSLTVLTGTGAALLCGLVTRAVLEGRHLPVSAAVAAVAAAFLVSVLARPDAAHGRSRRRSSLGRTTG